MSADQQPSFREAMGQETAQFEKTYRWIQEHLPPSFFEDADAETVRLLTHSLMGFDLQEFFSNILFKNKALALCLDTPEADLQILRHYRQRGIQSYRTFVSNAPPPFPGMTQLLRVAVIYFSGEQPLAKTTDVDDAAEAFRKLHEKYRELTWIQFENLMGSMTQRFLRSLTGERLLLAFDVLLRAEMSDACQLEVRRNEAWEQKPEAPSLQIVLAWKYVTQQDLLYRLVRLVHRHNLVLKRVAATHIRPYTRGSIAVMSLGLHGLHGKPVWEATDVESLLHELMMLKDYGGQELIENTFVETKLLKGTLGNFIKAMAHCIHQVLVHANPDLYSLSHVEEGLCRHPELTVLLARAFEAKFDPDRTDLGAYEELRLRAIELVKQIDTGQERHDARRKNILLQGVSLIHYMLKTNVYQYPATSFAFRFDPAYLNDVPFQRSDKFPELPYGVFFMKGLHFTGFHVRFRDLARGGLRTVIPARMEQLSTDRNMLFAECYNLALTQQKKNKDIPEGGAKGVILLEPYELLKSEEVIYQTELENQGLDAQEVQEKIGVFQRERRLEYLYQAQRSYIEGFVTLLNCEESGVLRSSRVIDYYRKPEYIYLGPDENMHNEMIVWISNYAKQLNYKPGISFMSSKPGAGINHKHYGVTSRGVHVYMEEVLKFLGIDPKTEPFRVKMTGGPDGDVAGNQMNNLFRYYPTTAKLITTVDVSGTIVDPEGLDLAIVAELFHQGNPIRCYPASALHEGGWILDVKQQREETAYTQQTLLVRKQQGKLVESWISGNEMNHLLRTTVHQTKADVFMPCGGRPRTLHDQNYRDFLDPTGKPTARAIVEGGNLYLSTGARKALERLGVVIIKDSSANKGGVICSSFEVLAGLVLQEEEFIAHKEQLVHEIIDTIEARARDEARTVLLFHGARSLSEVSDAISEKINFYTDELLRELSSRPTPTDPEDPWVQCFLNYCLPLLRSQYRDRLLRDVPEIHRRTIMACFVAQRLVYRKGFEWAPSIVDVLPLILKDSAIVSP